MTIQEALQEAFTNKSLIRPTFWKGMAVEPVKGAMWLKKPCTSDVNKSVYNLTPNDIVSEWEAIDLDTLTSET